jgi:hypothetical protein
MGYLVCDKCQRYYELQPGESPEDFKTECECGGKFRYVKTLEGTEDDFNESKNTIACPYCGAENPEDKKLCQSCKRVLKPSKTPPPRYKTTQSVTGSSDGGIFDWFNKQSNGRKAAMGLAGICCIALILVVAGSALFPDKNTATTNTTPPTTNTNTQTQPTTNSDVIVQVVTAGNWTGALDYSNSEKSVQGTGNDQFDLGPNPGIVSVNFQKGTNDTNPLTVNLIQGGNTVKTQTTTASQGIAAVTNNF